MARIILLNGCSSAGKSSLARAIQRAGDTPRNQAWLHVAMDEIIAMLPDGRETEPDWFPLSRAGGLVRIDTGPRGSSLLSAMRGFIFDLAERHLDVIVDQVCTHEEIAEYRARLARHALLVVKVDAPHAILEQREHARGDRIAGIAAEQSRRIRKGIAYDLIVSNSDGRLDLCAAEILAALENA